MDDRVPVKLFNRLSSSADVIRRHDFIHIFSHYDADGISAAAVLAKTIFREGKDFVVTLFSTLNEETMEHIRRSRAACVIMADLGASFLDQLEKIDKDIIVLDHHRTERDSEKLFYANPHLFGADGMTECCASSLSVLFSVTVNEKNWDLSQIAFAGIAGDRQHVNGMVGINSYILENAVKKKFIKLIDGSLIPPGPLTKELYLTTDPYISGISGNAEGVADIIENAGLPRSAALKDMDENERRKLSSLIALKLVFQNVTTKTMKEASRVRYELKDWNMDAEMFSDILNACGRLGLGGIGIAMGMGDERSRVNAEHLNDEYRNKIVEASCALDKKGLTKMDNIQCFDSSSSGFTGVLCGIAMQYLGDTRLPTVGVNSSDDTSKASARGTTEQLNRGIDLSIAMERAAKESGGMGGGHKIASGASFPSGSEKKFLDALDRIIKEQVTAK